MSKARRPKVTKKRLVAALEATQGHVFLAAKQLGCTARWVNMLLQKWPDVAETLQDLRGEMIDVTEAKLYANILKGDTTAIIFCLKTRAADRGYVEKQQHEMSGPGGGPLKQEVTGHVSLSIEEALAGCEAAFAAATIREGQEAGILPHDLQQPLPADAMEHAGLGEAGRSGSSDGDDEAEPEAD